MNENGLLQHEQLRCWAIQFQLSSLGVLQLIIYYLFREINSPYLFSLLLAYHGKRILGLLFDSHENFDVEGFVRQIEPVPHY